MKTDLLTSAEIAAYNRGLEDAAKIAQPAYEKKRPGSWANLRLSVAAQIRACKIENNVTNN